MLTGRMTDDLVSVLSISGTPAMVERVDDCTLEGGSIRGGPFTPARLTWVGVSTAGRSDVTRSDTLSALGPVGGAMNPEGALFLGAIDAGSVVTI